MRSIRINTVDKFDAEVNKAVETGYPVFVLFFGNELPETSQSWCPDCVIADPVIRKALLPIENAILLEASVGNRGDWRGRMDHPYRVRYAVPAIPSLYKWTIDGPGDKLVEEECADMNKLAAFVNPSSYN